MSKQTTKSFGKPTFEQQIIEERKLKALEKIANSLDALALWFEEVDKEEWGDRLQYYLAEWHGTLPKTEKEEEEEEVKDVEKVDGSDKS